MLRGKMVATRSGACANSSARNDETLLTTEATPTARVTKQRTAVATDKSQSEQTSDSQQENVEKQSKALSELASTSKRETRSSKCGPTDSTHEADVSDSESCCSVASGILAIAGTRPAPRSSRRAAARERSVAAEKQHVHEEESCSSQVSKPRRSTRSQKMPVGSEEESTTSQDNCQSEAESCSSVASLSKVIETQMITRSRRRTTVPPEEAHPSEADSCSSTVSGPQGSTVRRSTRNRRTRLTEPIPIHLEQGEATDTPGSSRPRRTIRRTGKSIPADEKQYDSEGCQSGPSTSPWRTTRSKVLADSDLETVATTYSSLDSPSSLRGKGTPCSSRTGSASSNRAVSVPRTRSNMRGASNVLDAPSVASECEEMESKKSERDQADTPMNVSHQSESPTVSDKEDVEENTEDEEANKTVIAANQERLISEDTKLDKTLALDEDNAICSSSGAEMVESESRQETECMEVNHSTEGQEKNEKDGKVIEECEKIANEAEFTQSSQSAEILKVSDEPEEKLEVPEDKMELLVCDLATKVDQDPSELAENSVGINEEAAEVLDECVAQKASPNDIIIQTDTAGKSVEDEQDLDVEQHIGMETAADAVSHKSEDWAKDEDLDPAQTEEEGLPCSSNVQKVEKLPMKGGLSLLDSSEDEGDEEEDDEHSDSEAEAVCSDENEPGPSGEADSPHSNALFVIDTRPGLRPCEKYYIDDDTLEGNDHDFKAAAEDDDDEEFVDEEGDDEDDEDSKTLFTPRKPAMTELSSSIDPGLRVKEIGGLYISFDGSKSKSVSNNLKKLKDQRNQDQLLKKSVIGADFEKKDAVPPYKESKHAAKLKRKEERAKTTGEGWFNMRAPELTEELRNDLTALRMRSAMDPKRFYKKHDREGLPKYFQVGTVVDSAVDFHHSRIPKKQRKRTIMEELLADAEFRSFNKRKYHEIMAEKAAGAAGRRNKKKHKTNKKK